MLGAVPRGVAGLQKEVFGLATNRRILHYLCPFSRLLRLHLCWIFNYFVRDNTSIKQQESNSKEHLRQLLEAFLVSGTVEVFLLVCSLSKVAT